MPITVYDSWMTITYAEHVGHRLEQAPAVLLQPPGLFEVVDGHPGVGRKALEHWHQKLQAARPVADQQHLRRR